MTQVGNATSHPLPHLHFVKKIVCLLSVPCSKIKMKEVAAGSLVHAAGQQGLGLMRSTHVSGRKCYAVNGLKTQKAVIMNQKPTTYTSRIFTDIPLPEAPGALFDQYLEDKPRVFRAIFPDKQRSEQLNEEEWRIQMLPIQFVFASVRPEVDVRMRFKSGGKDYPPEVPPNTTKVLELDITRWKLQGLDSLLEPSHFALGVKGILYPDRQEIHTRLKGQLEMNISFVLPPVLTLIPEDVRQSIVESVLKRLVENMKQEVNSSLLADYSEFMEEMPKNLA